MKAGMSDLDGSVGVSESENVWREIWGERESKGRERGVKERERVDFSLHLVDMRCVCVLPGQTAANV